ncbi:MAG: hypothetical protein K5873_04165 [Treponema sp.]|nr:hypothetical protein [Treponema sp.]
MIKIFSPGNKFPEKKLRLKKISAIENAGYAVFMASGILCILSFLLLSFLALSRTKLSALEREEKIFYQRLEEENLECLERWKNPDFAIYGEKSSEND